MVERNELITVCRQIGGMMEAGVDILRITRVLRAQTENPRLLQLYGALDHDMTMGHGLADAMSHAPDVFSPFMVLMVQQGEARNDLAGSFFKIADYVQKDGELTPESSLQSSLQTRPQNESGQSDTKRSDTERHETRNRVLDSRISASAAPLAVIALDGLVDRLQTFALRALTVISGLSLSLAGVWWSVEMGWLERRWSYPTAFSVAAIFMGVSGIVIQRRIRAERRREARCSFCGRAGTDGDQLQRAPRFAGAAICSRCANIAARQQAEYDERKSDNREVSEHEFDNRAADNRAANNRAADVNRATKGDSDVAATARNSSQKAAFNPENSISDKDAFAQNETSSEKSQSEKSETGNDAASSLRDEVPEFVRGVFKRERRGRTANVGAVAEEKFAANFAAPKPNASPNGASTTRSEAAPESSTRYSNLQAATQQAATQNDSFASGANVSGAKSVENEEDFE